MGCQVCKKEAPPVGRDGKWDANVKIKCLALSVRFVSVLLLPVCQSMLTQTHSGARFKTTTKLKQNSNPSSRVHVCWVSQNLVLILACCTYSSAASSSSSSSCCCGSLFVLFLCRATLRIFVLKLLCYLQWMAACVQLSTLSSGSCCHFQVHKHHPKTIA